MFLSGQNYEEKNKLGFGCTKNDKDVSVIPIIPDMCF